MFTRRLMGVCAAVVVATAACSGGGGSSSSPLPPGPVTVPSSQPQGNAYTSYSIFQGTVGSESVIDVTPIGSKSSIPGAIPVAGSVIYPDGSVQVADALGNFDTSQAAWTIFNLAMLQADPSAAPLVDVFYTPATGAAPNPEELSVVAYAPGGPRVPLDVTSEAATVPELATMSVAPKSAWLADGRTRLFSAYGKDQNGAPFALNSAQVVWSVKRANGCGNPAGTVAALPSNASRAIYFAPKSGSTSAGCADIVTASVTSGSVAYMSSGSAYSFDPAASPKLAGVLNDQNGKPVAKAVIDLYGAGADAAQGSLLVTTDGSGKFARVVPAGRVITPVVLTVNGAKASQYAITPASINPVTAGSALANQTWKLGSAVTIPKPVAPNYVAAIKEAHTYGGLMRAHLPLDTPAASGTFAAGSIEAILAAPKANASGTVTTGDFRKYSYSWDATGKVATFTQPGNSTETMTFKVTVNAAKVAGTACPSGAACYSYVHSRGTMLLDDGAWSQLVSGGKYAIVYVANEYSSTHQTSGSPLFVDTTQASVALGASGATTITQTHANAAGTILAQVSTTHTPASAPAVYNYSGTVKAFINGSKNAEVDFALSSGVVNEDGSGSFKFVTTSTPVAADKNLATTWTINAPSTASSSGKRSTGIVDLPSLSNLTSGHAGSFFVDQKNAATLTLDASLGGTTSTFPL